MMCLKPLDIEHWKALFPSREVRQLHSWDVQGYTMITSPFHIATIEQIRDECVGTSFVEGEVPTDVFVFARGEPPRRDVTKIGGLPYRPARKAWPKTRDGRDMTFLAQFRFTESRDICPDVPAAMLLVFARDNVPIDGDPDSFQFEWYESDLSDFVTPRDVPEPAWTFVKCHGIRHRTRDLPGQTEQFAHYRQPYAVAILEGTKIGGVPVKSPPPPPEIEVPDEPEHGEFLCSLGSIECKKNWPYPWLNELDLIQVAHQPFGQLEEQETLYWGDAGIVNFYLEHSGDISWTLFSY